MLEAVRSRHLTPFLRTLLSQVVILPLWLHLNFEIFDLPLEFWHVNLRPGFHNSAGWSGLPPPAMGRRCSVDTLDSRELAQPPVCMQATSCHPLAHTLLWNWVMLPRTANLKSLGGFLPVGLIPKKIVQMFSHRPTMCQTLWALGLLSRTHRTSFLCLWSYRVYKHRYDNTAV